MKKTALSVALYIFLCFILSSCSKNELQNILLFTDSLNKLYEYPRYSISDYMISGNNYSLEFQNGSSYFLLCLNENENGLIEALRLTMSKTDENGRPKEITDNEALLYKESASKVISAYAGLSVEETEEKLSSLLPEKGADYKKTGELKLSESNFTFIFYCNDIGCFISVSNNKILKAEITEKPVSKPLFGETTFKRTNP